MGTEIERKFLVVGDAWRDGAAGVPYSQGYISREEGHTVRIRIAGENAFLTIKGPVVGISRAEFEYPIPLEDARHLLEFRNGPMIRKRRFRIPHEGHIWEVDEFEGANAGLIVAEIELKDPDEDVPLPAWIGTEVTGDSRYYNSNLTLHPYCEWREEAGRESTA